jgi:hypothetical protein
MQSYSIPRPVHYRKMQVKTTVYRDQRTENMRCGLRLLA